jgi:hypothetical protein
MSMVFGTWKVRRLYRAGPMITFAREITKYRLVLLGLQVRWNRGGNEPVDDYTFFYGNGNENHELWLVFFVHKRITSAV